MWWLKNHSKPSSSVLYVCHLHRKPVRSCLTENTYKRKVSYRQLLNQVLRNSTSSDTRLALRMRCPALASSFRFPPNIPLKSGEVRGSLGPNPNRLLIHYQRCENSAPAEGVCGFWTLLHNNTRNVTYFNTQLHTTQTWNKDGWK